MWLCHTSSSHNLRTWKARSCAHQASLIRLLLPLINSPWSCPPSPIHKSGSFPRQQPKPHPIPEIPSARYLPQEYHPQEPLPYSFWSQTIAFAILQDPTRSPHELATMSDFTSNDTAIPSIEKTSSNGSTGLENAKNSVINSKVCRCSASSYLGLPELRVANTWNSCSKLRSSLSHH